MTEIWRVAEEVEEGGRWTQEHEDEGHEEEGDAREGG